MPRIFPNIVIKRFYVVLFLQVDAVSVRFGLKGLPKDELPNALRVLLTGWIYLIPIAVLLYYLFWLGFNPASRRCAASACCW